MIDNHYFEHQVKIIKEFGAALFLSEESDYWGELSIKLPFLLLSLLQCFNKTKIYR